MGTLKSEVRKGDVSGVKPLIRKKAYATWLKLPRHVQTWVSVEDLVNEGIALAVTKVAKLHRKGSASYLTYLYVSLDHFYSDYLEKVYAEKRKSFSVLSLSPEALVRRNGKLVSVQEWARKKIDPRRTTEDQIIARIDSERAFLLAYHKATPNLKKYMTRWLLQPKDTKFKLYGNLFLSAVGEFRRLRMTEEDCNVLFCDYWCRQNILVKLDLQVEEKRPDTLNRVLQYK